MDLHEVVLRKNVEFLYESFHPFGFALEAAVTLCRQIVREAFAQFAEHFDRPRHMDFLRHFYAVEFVPQFPREDCRVVGVAFREEVEPF